jgi:hypothetical protein
MLSKFGHSLGGNGVVICEMDCISLSSGALECCQSISEEIVALVHLKCPCTCISC